MRLIDADALLKLFVVTESGRRIPEVDIDNFPNTVSIKEIKDIIRHQPTAYDVDNVVEMLEEYSTKIESSDLCLPLYYRNRYGENECYYGESVVRLEDICNVINGGGADETD